LRRNAIRGSSVRVRGPRHVVAWPSNSPTGSSDRGSIEGKTRYDVRDADVLLEKYVNGLS
jgi:hypothetical protein